jgi:hypothetical protein
MKDGRRFGAPPKPYRPPELPEGQVNTTDSDSRVMKTFGRYALQGYNAQAAVNEHQILVAAEVTVDAPDFGHLEPSSTPPSASLKRSAQHDRRPSSPTPATGMGARWRTLWREASRC